MIGVFKDKLRSILDHRDNTIVNMAFEPPSLSLSSFLLSPLEKGREIFSSKSLMKGTSKLQLQVIQACYKKLP